MEASFLKKLGALELEEKIISAGSMIAAVGILLPWLEEQQSYTQNTSQLYNGLQHLTSFVGTGVLLVHLFLLAIILAPLSVRRNIVKKAWRSRVRLWLTSAAVLLMFAALSVDLNVTFSSTGSQIRYGLYVSLIGSLLTLLYAVILWQQDSRHQGQQWFQHPEERTAPEPPTPIVFSPAASPPPPPPMEEHPLYRS